MMNLAKKISNCIRAYVMGDALGVPFEFQNKVLLIVLIL